jgi:hypothetical protein
MQTDTRPGRGEPCTDVLIVCGLVAGFLALYLRTLCRTVYLGDSGEFCTAIVTGGVAHPPGYPLFSLLGRAALAWIPAGEPAFRIGCVVALAAAGAVGVLYLLARELGSARWASAAAAVLFGAGYTFWSQSVRVEVYSLHVLLAGLLLLSALRYRRTGSLASLATASIAGSLGLGHHLTIALLAPAVLLLCGARLCTDRGLPRRLALLLTLLPVGPALYLLLMVWARAEPLHAWGHTVTLPLLWNHASARIFAGFLEIPDTAALAERLTRTGGLLTDNFPYMTVALPVVGLGLLWRRDRVVAGALLAVMGAVAAYNLCYPIDDIAPYYLVVVMVAASLLAMALDAFGRVAGGRFPVRAVAWAAPALLLAGLLARNWASCDLSGAEWVRELARHKLESADPGSVLVMQGDDDTNPIWYVHDVLNVRPDVIPIDRPSVGTRMWLMYERDPSLWYLHRLRRQGVNVPVEAPRDAGERQRLAEDRFLIRMLTRELAGRPVCATFARPGAYFFEWASERCHLLPVGIVLRLHPRNRPVDLSALVAENARLWSRITLPEASGVRTDQEMAPEYVTSHYACMLVNFGSLQERAGDLEAAATLYRRAAALAPGYRPAAAALTAVRRQASADRETAPAER